MQYKSVVAQALLPRKTLWQTYGRVENFRETPFFGKENLNYHCCKSTVIYATVIFCTLLFAILVRNNEISQDPRMKEESSIRALWLKFYSHVKDVMANLWESGQLQRNTLLWKRKS